MYEEISIKRKIDWKSLLIKGGILLIVVFIVCAIAFAPRKTYAVTPLNDISLELLNAGKEYYTFDKLPSSFGESRSITLMELTEKELIKATNFDSNKCSFNDSYVKVIKVNTKEFSISAYVSCDNKDNTVIDTIKTEKDNATNASKNGDNFSAEVVE